MCVTKIFERSYMYMYMYICRNSYSNIPNSNILFIKYTPQTVQNPLTFSYNYKKLHIRHSPPHSPKNLYKN